ncbi:(Fe-S)-binding protein [Neptunomonas antarctica]|uniref:L-lactate dehydrogenase complex protein LldE n=1 Tax=Neptunomonas antarctica TaxID=619304 RepID=A0A1N7M4R5_9GAMM|nr:(Fe-S)-binding protein [Neptunomonas antarctica]SIS80941.1 L-lactate dehydrogenase complex protein LldE [Neptunomonas antarctica]
MLASEKPIQVGLFVTCLVDMFRPSIGFATIKLLENAGCNVTVPEAQTCCGQPAFNSGDKKTTQDIARQTITAFDGFEYVVGPSGSCIGMLHQYVDLFDDTDPWKARAEDLRNRAFEITSFLVDVIDFDSMLASYEGNVTYHDSCAGLRELGVKQQPRKLLANVANLSLTEMEDAETCCGFGGTFCVKYPEISNRMVENKSANVQVSGATTLLGGDLGCLLNMAGKLKRQGHKIETRHIVEVLAGMTDEPAIGDSAYELGQPA